jgi:D-beta-D-heptose 7-phosphate kinase/D-beta-D-heptose 1-phosphate adenosyltransferase
MTKNLGSDHQPIILVIGDMMIDHYIWGDCTRISPEAPVQVVNVKDETENLGGSLNVINNLVSLGASVYAAGVIGNDAAGKTSLEKLRALNVNTDAVIAEENRPTTLKSRILSANHQMMRIDREQSQSIKKTTQDAIVNYVKKNISRFSIILLSDYGKGVLTVSLCAQVIGIAKENNIKVLVDPKGSDYSKYYGAHLITPNKREATQASGIELVSEQALVEAGALFKKTIGLDKVVMTLGEQGIALYDDDLHLFPTMAREVYDVTGAGDTVLAALGYSLSTGHSIADSCKFANAAAAVVIGKVGSATATLREIMPFLLAQDKSSEELKLVEPEQLDELIQHLKTDKKKIVFTNGCFDILHAGHVSYLQKAKKLGDVLIVGLNSDESVRKLKGPTRPVNSQQDRAFVLAGLNSIDHIVVFGEDTPYELIKQVEPDLLVKGKDYENKEVVGSDIAKEVVLIEFVQGKSTTGILEKINSL